MSVLQATLNTMTRIETCQPTHPDSIFDPADRERIENALDGLRGTAAYNEADLSNFPARAWGDLLDRLGLPDLAARARAELAPMSPLAAPIFNAIRGGLLARALHAA